MLEFIRSLSKNLIGKENPLTSLTFWGVLVLSGLPAAIAQHTGIPPELMDEKVGMILAILGIRRTSAGGRK